MVGALHTVCDRLVGSRFIQVKRKTIKSALITSPLIPYHIGARTMTDWLEIKMIPRAAPYLPAEY